MKKSIIVFLLVVAISPCLLAQKKPALDSIANLSLSARYTGNEVRIRWAPGRAGAWTLLNRVGYQLERFEIDANGERSNLVKIGNEVIKPEPFDNWKRFATPGQENEYALIAAQTIYGKKFTTTKSSMTQQADELTNRFGFALLAADLNFDAAMASGLGFVDSTIQKGKTYIYKLGAAGVLTNYMAVDTAFEIVGTSAIKEIQKPEWGLFEEKEGQVVLSWNKEIHDKHFSAYFIERSLDGVGYNRVNKKPYVNMSSDIEDKPEFTYSDSVGNYIPYHYRLIGITPFGEESEASKPIIAMGQDKTPPSQPSDVQAKALPSGKIEITWDAESAADLAGFYIGQSNDPLTGFKPLFENPLPNTARSYIDQKPASDTTNYYLVIAVDTAQNATASLSVFTSVSDTIPPAPPTGLVAKIDTNGIINLQWKGNLEKDIKGYIVLFANQRDHDFTTAVRSAISDTIFTDSVRLWTLTEKIFYQVKAVDNNNNTSSASEILEVLKPDIVPPSNPVFKAYQVAKEGVSIEWIPSSSLDVVWHIISRRESNIGEFKQLTMLPIGSSTLFLDSTTRSGKQYEYQLIAIDDAGLRSTNPPTFQIIIPDYIGKKGVDGFKVSFNQNAKAVEIVWSNPAGSKGTMLYRSQNGGAFQNISSLDAKTTKYLDKQAKAGVNYQYTAKVQFLNGESSSFLETVAITF